MLSFIFKRFSGRHYKKFLEKCRPIVARINELEQSYQSLTDEQLRAKTDEFRARLAQATDKRVALDAILPEAFATVKNAARRLVGHTAVVCDHELKWDMVHFDVQLIGGIAIHEGKIAEMATGEGKTLVSTLPLYLNALVNRNTQLVTVNDYLARRDSEWMGHLYNFLGVTVGCIQQQMSPDLRREMYGRDITYGTASEFGFDYLRDNGMATRKEDQVQRDYWFCIVDEIDSILVDEARTPLIISGPAPIEREQPFTRIKPPIEQLVNERVIDNARVEAYETEFDRKPEGTLAFFGDKYGRIVRVVDIGGYSRELCGGTHVATTGEIGLIRIAAEMAIAAGTRRIEAVAGQPAYALTTQREDALAAVGAHLSAGPQDVVRKLEQLLAHQKETERQLRIFQQKATSAQAESLAEQAVVRGPLKFVSAVVSVDSPATLRSLGSQVLARLGEGVVQLGAVLQDKASLVAYCSPAAIAAGHQAGRLVQALSAQLGGKGGGKPDFAMGGGRETAKLGDVLKA